MLESKRFGRHVVTPYGDEQVRAFVPPPLPPDPPVNLQGLQLQLERANQALGRLDGITTILPDPLIFLYNYVRKEAVLSSQIEGTQSSLSDLLLFELEETPGVPIQDVQEVSSYVAALNFGLERLKSGFPLSLRLIREIHGVLLADGRGSEKDPGEFRRSQNWIGGTRPGNAAYVPPPPELVTQCMGELELFLHVPPTLPLLVRVGLIHAQFETIHPFLDGNGRLGRLLITFLLCQGTALREPLLYVSLFFKTHRQRYYELLNRTRTHGDWEAWLDFFLQAVCEVAEQATQSAKEILALLQADRAAIRQSSGSALRVFDYLQRKPVISVSSARAATGLSFPAAAKAITTLEALGILREVTGKQRNRVFSYERYLAILREGTEPLPR